jgi:hypothetical protein
MDSKQIAQLTARHDHLRVKAKLTWEGYLYARIADNTLSFPECVELAHAHNLPLDVQAEVEIRLYERAGNKGAVQRATERYRIMFAQTE